MTDPQHPQATPDRKTRTAIGVALAGVGISALAGAAMGFEHTVTVARAYGAPAYWDIVTAASVEVLPITGTALLYVCHRLGWPTHWPYRVIMLGSILTLGAQLSWYGNEGQGNATADPQVLGYAVASLPSAVTLILVAIGHAALGYANQFPAPAADPVPEAAVPPTPIPQHEPLPTPEPVPTPPPTPEVAAVTPTPVPVAPTRPQVPRPVPATRVAGTPDTPVQAAVRNFLEAALGAADADQLEVVRSLPRGKTGRPSVAAIREALKVGQTKAQELRDEAFPAGSQDKKDKPKILKVEGNARVIERDSHVDKEGEGKSEGKKKGEGTNTTSVDQGSARPAAGPEPTALRVVGGGRA